ncbi:MAG: hypothetical protein NTW17_02910 [Candidatus Pacearchaeota archaeon]|nr:hypothetical protein [Candidatus Pacearchaeota archaeon]
MEIEPKERFVIEIIAGVILVAFLILISVVVINASEGSETKITNSFNTYNINTEPVKTDSGLKPYIVDDRNHAKVYYIEDNSKEIIPEKRDLQYDSWSEYGKVKGIFGNDIARYDVYVKNKDYTGGYFKVIYYFEDYEDDISTESYNYYIGPREEKRFTFKDVTPSRYDYKKWGYEIKPQTKTSSKAHHENNVFCRTSSCRHQAKIYFYED